MTEQCKHKYRGHYAELVYEESPPEVKRNPPMIYICEYCKEVLDWKEAVQMLNEYETLKAATERLSAEDVVANTAQIELCEFECQAGPLELNNGYIRLRDDLQAYANILEGKDE